MIDELIVPHSGPLLLATMMAHVLVGGKHFGDVQRIEVLWVYLSSNPCCRVHYPSLSKPFIVSTAHSGGDLERA